ncbi:Arginase/deacetylase [Amylocystis lapponica]|nr:Arginase/deacetylase [Amylocystis lapponica]
MDPPVLLNDLPPPRTAIFLQKACLYHRYIRSKDQSHIVERPERLRAVHLGLAAATARLESAFPGLEDAPNSAEHTVQNRDVPKAETDTDSLVAALGGLNIASSSSSVLRQPRLPLDFVHSGAAVDLLNDPAVKFVHGDIDGDVYLEDLQRWVKESQVNIAQRGSEIPERLPQGDLYLCPGSMDAIQGALGTVCEAVDTVMGHNTAVAQDASTSRAFVAIRPPGHHCGEDTPSGFCFVNNVIVAAAHAHLKHNINRVVILDIDLHHGNGTQALAWQINEETYRKKLEEESGAPTDKPGLQIYYGSLHDVLSFPCEDGKPDLVQAASVSIHGAHGQHIENVHLKPYSSEKQFWEELYAGPYSRLLDKARDFLEETGGAGSDALIFISCGFDACEHEYPSMSRHHRNVPTAFYNRFARDVRKLADRYALGRLVSVLEGGYSDRALTSGAMAHLVGLIVSDETPVDESWWSSENLVELEKAAKKRRGGRPSMTASEPWLSRTLEIFASIDSSHLVSTPSTRAAALPSSRTLRDRKKPGSASADPSPVPSPGKQKKSSNKMKDIGNTGSNDTPPAPASSARSGMDSADSATSSSLSELSGDDVDIAPKKLPRVILRLGPPPGPPATS